VINNQAIFIATPKLHSFLEFLVTKAHICLEPLSCFGVVEVAGETAHEGNCVGRFELLEVSIVVKAVSFKEIFLWD